MSEKILEEKVYCRLCKRKTNHNILKEIKDHSGLHEDSPIGYDDDYYIVQCRGCDTYAFVNVYSDESMQAYFVGEAYHYKDFKVYPEEPKINDEPLLNRNQKEFVEAPESIVKLYNQVISSYTRNDLLLTGVGLRMILEGICLELNIKDGPLFNEDGEVRLNKKDEEIKSGSLEGKINGLYKEEHIVKKHTKILQEIRDLGNATAHELKVPTRRVILLALEAVEQLIINVYEMSNMSLK